MAVTTDSMYALSRSMKQEVPLIRYIAIEGPIGVGKSTLADMLAHHFRARLILERLIERWQQRCSAPIVDDALAASGKIEVASDHDGRFCFSRESANYIAGFLVDGLLLRGASDCAEKLADCFLALFCAYFALFEPFLDQIFDDKIDFQSLRETRAGEECGDYRGQWDTMCQALV